MSEIQRAGCHQRKASSPSKSAIKRATALEIAVCGLRVPQTTTYTGSVSKAHITGTISYTFVSHHRIITIYPPHPLSHSTAVQSTPHSSDV